MNCATQLHSTCMVARSWYGYGVTGWSPAPSTRFIHQALVGRGGVKVPHRGPGTML